MPMRFTSRCKKLPLMLALMLAFAGHDQVAAQVAGGAASAQGESKQPEAAQVPADAKPAAGVSGQHPASAGKAVASDARPAADSGARPAADAGAKPGTGAAAKPVADAESLPGANTDAAPAPDAVKVAFVLPTKVDASGWSRSHDAAIKALGAQLGRAVDITVRENIIDIQAEKVFRELVAAGNKLIIAADSGYLWTMQRLAAEHPEVRWEVVGLGDVADNIRTYAVRAYEGAWLAGVLAGKLSRTDTLGFIATLPVPDVVRNINAFTLGAQAVNPSARVKVAWINGWVDPVRETEAAQSLINSGADVLLFNSATGDPLKVAERAGVSAISWGVDMSDVSAKAQVAAVGFNWTDYYVESVREVAEKRWRPQSSWAGVREGRVDLVSLASRLPADVVKAVEEKRKELVAGKVQIWKGPLVSADDRELLPSGKVGDDAFLADLISYVKGVEGQVPSGQKEQH